MMTTSDGSDVVSVESSSKITYLFVDSNSMLPMDIPPGNTVFQQVGPTYYSRDEDTGELEVLVYVKPSAVPKAST